MVGRSLKASPEGIDLAEKALIRKILTKKALAEQLDIARSTVTKFFGQNPIDRKNFEEICDKLDLDWREIVAKPPDSPESSAFEEEIYPDSEGLDALVKQVREKVRPSISERCGTMRVLDMTQPIGLNEIYIDVNILETIASCRRKTIDDFWQGCTPENFDRFGLGKVTAERVPGKTAVETYSKLMVLGKPGAGKTTFLKHLASECIGGNFQADRVPIFITLKQFAETERKLNREELTPPLDTYISQMFAACGVTTNSVEQLLHQGRALVLLDGLDEVRDLDYNTVLNRIRDFYNDFHANQFVMTCRIAAREYTFENFTDVEVADFDEQQIAEFVRKWFHSKDAAKVESFLEQLSANQPIKELAKNPLLLTLLCLVFEESAEFPSNRSELYKEGLDILLKKWDAKRNIERDSVYKKLSLQRKQDLLSSIALTTFARGEYFFKQQELERHIGDYIRNLPDAQTDEEVFRLDIESVLKSIEAQHGLLVERARKIYSFSHLTFQEYLTARKIVDNRPQALDTLTNHITEKSWRELFLLTVGMMPLADELLLLMKKKVDALIASDEELQQLMSWVSQKCDRVKVPDKPASVRGFYLALFRVFYWAFARSFAPTSDSYNRARRFIRNFNRARTFTYEKAVLALDISFNLKPDLDPAYAIACVLTLDFELELRQTLEQLSVELPNSEQEEEIKKWKQANGQTWTETLKAVITQPINIKQDWHFSEERMEALNQYICANKLLVECLQSDCYVTQDVRHEIENRLLLPTLPVFGN